ncbi:hypothetical protein TARUN_10120 [Trichoderma arundinaceum]|uniref:Kri1-like C-terminal domain-containing protein n=1 Tax=Trichoderma arundinaceum TaxID=490622 RepID=A0A395N8D6_TRIAR|nr:hypothetical protein TARUN_10120 [Trichoderma arundinaceum]
MAGPTSQAAATKDKPSGSNKRKLLDDSDSDSDDGGAAIGSSSFKVNEEYARRFEHNKKREEKHRLEEKLKREGENDDSSSSDETEDEDGFLATEDLDAQISATLKAIRNKDPRVYDKETTFYEPEDENGNAVVKEKKEKPVFLRDYQREKILRGDVGGSDDEEEAPTTYQQEQDAIKKSLLSEINATKNEQDSDDSDEDEDGFIKRKEPAKTDASGVHPSRAKAVKLSEVDVSTADRDPETFLSNFMAARAWVADEGLRWEAFESDDGEEDNRADEFEQAYNLRFEDPEKSNEVLKSYARDFAAARSVRREEKTGRKRQRELEREKKEAEKEQRLEDKARLRKLKLEETEGKLRKIKQAAGAFGKELTDEQWMKFLDDAWENDKWEDEMKKWFDEGYYAINEANVASDDEDGMDIDGGDSSKKSHKNRPKKPKWDDDIDINDIIPDFEDDKSKPNITLTDDEAQDEDDGDEDDEEPSAKKLKSSDRKRARQESQKKTRQERSKLEALVEAKMHLTDHDVLKDASSGGAGLFRYRETSPQSFGMTARDILLAPSDKVLNEYAGLKKLATFRDVEKKRRDKKHLGKKARLRQWRRDVFGGEFEHTGPTYGFERVAVKEDGEENAREKKSQSSKKGKSKAKDGEEESSNIIGDVDGSRKKRKRSKGKKAAKGESEN